MFNSVEENIMSCYLKQHYIFTRPITFKNDSIYEFVES